MVVSDVKEGGKGWNFREEEDWMCVIRQENEKGQFIRLLVSHNREVPDTLIFPIGDNGDGCRDPVGRNIVWHC